MKGRESLVQSLYGDLRAGRSMLLYGQLGAGKTTVLRMLKQRAVQDAVPCAVSPQTQRPTDITDALERIWPEAAAAGSQRQRYHALCAIASARPGIVLLDHLRVNGHWVKGIVRDLQIARVGVMVAADVEHERDHLRLRSLRLTPLEVPIPPLDPTLMNDFLKSTLQQHGIELAEADSAALLEMARGRPGWIVRLVGRLSSPGYWCGSRLRLQLLHTDVTMAIGGHYLRR